jgi:hypothetical protein
MQFGKLATVAAAATAFSFGAMALAQEIPAEAAPAQEMQAPETQAQEAPAPGGAAEPAPATPLVAADFTEEQLGAFVAAALEVNDIQQQAAEQLVTVEDEAAQQNVVQEANRQMIGVIEAEPGITVPEYVAIAQAAETDPALRERIEEIIMARAEQLPQ